MTMPLLMNCEHQPEGLCDKCRKEFEGQCDDDHHAMMNGPRIRQSLGLDKLSNEEPRPMFEWILKDLME